MLVIALRVFDGGCMSRLRRPFLSDRYFFVTVRLLKERARLSDADLQALALAFNRARAPPHHLVGDEIHQQRRCGLTVDRTRLAADESTRI